MNNEISVKLKVVDEGGSIKTVTVNVKEFGKAIEKIKGQINDLDKQKINFSTLTQGLDSICNTLDKASAAFDELSDIYSKQIESETKLAQVMSNTMNATEADVQAIKDLCSAQQELGVIGDEVQLAGAQELATYLEKQSSLEALIPVMNDMVAQQYGYNASQESAAQIATMMGKVMEGQTAALSRYGYSFTEAQEQILKFGTEEERAATLAEVVEQSVGGVNKRLAETPYGKMVQLRNSIGDVKEVLGKVVAQMQPFYTGLSSIVQLGAGITTLTKGANAFGGSLKKVGAGIKAFCASNPLLMAFTAVAAIATTVIALLHNAKQETEELKEQSEAYNSAVASATAQMNEEIASLKQLIESHSDTADAVNRLNTEYGNTFGTFQTAEEWYQRLIDKSKEYALAMGLEGKTKKMNEQLADIMVKKNEAEQKAARIAEKYGTTGFVEKKVNRNIETGDDEADEALRALGDSVIQVSTGYNEATAEAQKYEAQATQLANQLDVLRSSLNKLKTELKNSNGNGLETNEEPSITDKPIPKESIAGIKKQISELKTQLELEIDPASRVKLQQEIDDLQGKVVSIKFELEANMQGLSSDDYAKKIIQEQMEEDMLNLDEVIDVEPLVKDLKVVRSEIKKTVKQGESFSAMGELMHQVGGAVQGTAQAWLDYGANVLTAIGQAIPAIMKMIAINASATASERAKKNEQVGSAAAGAMSAYSEIPFVGIVLGLAAVASIIAAMRSVPKFANGGIAYGPTLGLFGEYAGATNNPEVVAPLNKLKSLIGDANGGGGNVQFRIQGRDLVGVLSTENNIMKRR